MSRGISNFAVAMELCLTIDRGNTALKAALWDGCGALVRHTVSFDPQATPADLAASLLPEGQCLKAAGYCTVVVERREADLLNLRSLGIPVLDLNAATPMPMQICYGTPATLGADRIAAAAGALHYAQGRPVLIADVGTAVTYDYVDAGGRYLGGNIAPGISMRLAALHSHTSALPEVEVRGAAPVWGGTTAEALRSGTLRGVAAELEYYRRHAGDRAVTVLTGGSTPILAEAGVLDFKYIFDPCLVHRGLYSILKYNEN